MAKNVMSPEGRAKIVAAQKARWAKKRAQAETTKIPIAEIPVVEATVDSPPPPPPSKKADPPNPITECINCGWSDTDSTFIEAITKHSKDKPECTRPCLTHPNKLVLKKRALRELARLGRK